MWICNLHEWFKQKVTIRLCFKFGFVGERQGAALHPLKGLLKKSLKNPQNFQKMIFSNAF